LIFGNSMTLLSQAWSGDRCSQTSLHRECE